MSDDAGPDLPSVRAEPVGSLLRPSWLLDARERRDGGDLRPAAFKRLEDRAVDRAVALQEEAGLPVVTDGEMRRLSFQSRMTRAVEGFGEPGLAAFLWGEWRGDEEVGDRSVERPEGLAVSRTIRRRRSLSAEEFVYLRSRTDRIPKVTLPSPGLFANFWSPDASAEPYPELDDFLRDVTAVLVEEVRELADLGCRYVQIDAPHYALLLEPSTRRFYEERGWDRDRWLRRGPELDNRVMEAAPEISFGLHVCRGNQESRWLAEGGYDPLTPLFRRTRARRLLLEYDDERAGPFDPLDEVPSDRTVVLGLVSTKRASLEHPDALVERVRRAAEVVPVDRLAVSPQCGFGTSVVGNRIPREAQRRKLELVVETARRVWGEAA